MNYLGIDYGEKNIGLALADDELKIARPFCIVNNLKQIQKIIKQEKINKIIIGLPKGFKQETEQTKKTREFAKNFSNFEFIDERLTSKINKNHAGSAALILQTFLDRL